MDSEMAVYYLSDCRASSRQAFRAAMFLAGLRGIDLPYH